MKLSEKSNYNYILSTFIILIAFIFNNANCIRFPDRVAQPAREQPDQQRLQTAVFALGSFWRSEAVFGCLPGVVRTTVGYSGGSKPNPEYRSFGDHAESVQVLVFNNFFLFLSILPKLLYLFKCLLNKCFYISYFYNSKEIRIHLCSMYFL